MPPAVRAVFIAVMLAAALGGCAAPPRAEVAAVVVAGEPTAGAPATATHTTTPPAVTPTTLPAATNAPTPTAIPAATGTPTPDGPTPTSAPTDTLTPTPTTPPLLGYTIDALAAREYGEGDLLVAEEQTAPGPYHQYVMEYRSDGLTVTALAYVPFGEGPFPVIVVLHGYIPPEQYYRGLDANLLADTYARNGYAAIMPDYRGYMGTAGGPNPMRIPYAVDTLNLIGALGTLDVLDETRVGVVGHSMGGGVASYVMVLAPQVDAVVLYGSMSADQAANWYYIGETWSRYWMDSTARLYGSPETHPELYAAISPVNYLDRVRMPVQIHHGDADEVVPVEWSRELAARLTGAGVQTSYYEYPGGPHTFYGAELALLRERTLSFFNAYVKYKDAGVSTGGRSPRQPHS